MALRCFTALKNSESRSGAMKFPPIDDRSLRSLTRLDISDLRRAGSTPVLVWYSLSTLTCRSSSFKTSLRESPRAVMARISSKLETAARELQGLDDSLWYEAWVYRNSRRRKVRMRSLRGCS